MFDKLKPCPFCGSDKIAYSPLDGYVICTSCLASGPAFGGVKDNKIASINYWNKRTES